MLSKLLLGMGLFCSGTALAGAGGPLAAAKDLDWVQNLAIPETLPEGNHRYIAHNFEEAAYYFRGEKLDFIINLNYSAQLQAVFDGEKLQALSWPANSSSLGLSFNTDHERDPATREKLVALFLLWYVDQTVPAYLHGKKAQESLEIKVRREKMLQSYGEYRNFVQKKLSPMFLQLAQNNGEDSLLKQEIAKAWRDYLLKAAARL